MEELDKVMKSLIDHDKTFQFHEEALSEISQKVKRGEKIVRKHLVLLSIFCLLNRRRTSLGLMKLRFARRRMHIKPKHPAKNTARWTTT